MTHLARRSIINDGIDTPLNQDLLAQLSRIHQLSKLFATVAGSGAATWPEWCTAVDNLLLESDEDRVHAPGSGIHTELRYWSQRCTRLHAAISECKQWGGSGLQEAAPSYCARLTDALAEAEDITRYMLALEPWMDMMYVATTTAAVTRLTDQVDGIVNALSHSIAASRYLSAPHRAAILFQQTSNRMASLSVVYVSSLIGGGNIWNADVDVILRGIQVLTRLHARFHAEFHACRSNLQGVLSGPQLEFSTVRVFRRFDAVIARLVAVADMLTNAKSLRQLSSAPIHGLSSIVEHVDAMISVLTRRRYDPLDVGTDAQLRSIEKLAGPAAALSRPTTPELRPLATQSFRTPMFPPIATPSVWSTANVSDVRMDVDAGSAQRPVTPSLDATPRTPQLAQPTRTRSIRATRHLQEATSSVLHRSLSPLGKFLCFRVIILAVLQIRFACADRAGSRRFSQSLLSEAAIDDSVLSPVGMSASAAVEADAVLTASVRYRHRHPARARRHSSLSRASSSDAFATSSKMDSKFIASLALRKETSSSVELFGPAIEASLGSPTFGADYSSFQARCQQLAELACQLVLRAVTAQSSALHATIIAGIALMQPALSAPRLSSALVDILNAVADNAQHELERAEALIVVAAGGLTLQHAQQTQQFHRRFIRVTSLFEALRTRLPAIVWLRCRLPALQQALRVMCEQLKSSFATFVAFWKEAPARVNVRLEEPVCTVLEGRLVINWPIEAQQLFAVTAYLSAQGATPSLPMMSLSYRQAELRLLFQRISDSLSMYERVLSSLQVDPIIRPLLLPVVTSTRDKYVHAVLYDAIRTLV